MRNLLITLSLLSLVSLSFAGSKKHAISFLTSDNIENLKDNFIDYENTCMSGCLYYSPSVKEIKIIPNGRTADKFYVWISIDDVKDSQAFSRIEIKRYPGQIIIEQEQVQYEIGRAFEESTGLPHNPLFKKNEILIMMTEKSDGETRVDYQIYVKYGLLLNPLGGRIEAAIKDIAEAAKLRLTK